VQWLLHRRMGARQQMRRSPRGAHLMLQVRTAIVNETFETDHGSITRRRRSFRMAACVLFLLLVLIGVSFPYGFLEHPFCPASPPHGARARLRREAIGRSLAAGRRRCGTASYFRVGFRFSSVAFSYGRISTIARSIDSQRLYFQKLRNLRNTSSRYDVGSI